MHAIHVRIETSSSWWYAQTYSMPNLMPHDVHSLRAVQFWVCSPKCEARPFAMGQELLTRHAAQLPSNPAGFPLPRAGPPEISSSSFYGAVEVSSVASKGKGGRGKGGSSGSGKRALQVLLENRRGPVRSVRNMEDILAACAAMNDAGELAGE